MTGTTRRRHAVAARRVRLAAGLVAAFALLTACGGSASPASGGSGPVVEVAAGGPSATGGAALHGTEIGDVITRPGFALPDTTGRTFDLRARPAGELTVLFFGYTRCPDVCPTAMADLAAAGRRLPPADRERVQVAFVTEDPETDTPPVLRAWLDRFDPDIAGLIGGDERTERALDALKAPRTELLLPVAEPGTGRASLSASPHPHRGAQAHDGHTHTTASGKTVEHTGSVYAFLGDRVVVYTGGTTPEQYAQDFQTLLGA